MYPYQVQTKSPSALHTAAVSSAKNETGPCISPDLKSLLETALEEKDTSLAKCRQMLHHLPSPQQKEILYSIYVDEAKHKKYLEKIYTLTTGQSPLPSSTKKNSSTDMSPEAIKKYVFDTLETGSFYTRLYLSFEETVVKDLFFEMIQDCHNTAIKLSFL